ncbi:hypothetical protein FRB90_003466 [Tulasnella sp. 427]|nr:hypothetical protein FRB90_003466 [Tulasnella sp. 427]
MRMQSGIFNDMMDIPQPPEPAETMGPKIPVVDMPDDAVELEAALNLIYHPEKALSCAVAQETFDKLGIALPLLRKYEMDQLLRSCITRIRLDCPVTLKEWDMRNEQISAVQDTEGFPWVCHIIVEPAGVVAMALQVPELGFLRPAAFYDLSYADRTLSDTETLDPYYEAIILEHGKIVTRWSLLADQDFQTLERGTRALRSEIASTAQNLRNGLTPTVGQYDSNYKLEHDGCSLPIPGGVATFISSILDGSVATPTEDPIAYIKIKANATYPKTMCSTCIEVAREFLMGYREHLWKELPTFFSYE